MKYTPALIIALAVNLLGMLPAWAQEATPATDAPATTAQAPAVSLDAEVLSVKGVVRKRLPAEGAKWETVSVGDKLSEQTLIRTGLGSECVLKFVDRGVVVVRAGTKAGIGEFQRQGGEGGKVTANMGLKYGSVRTTVDSSKGENDFSVSTATATGAIRGSEMDTCNSEFGPGFSQNEGQARLQYVNGLIRRLVAGAMQQDGSKTPAQILNDFYTTGFGDVNGGLTPAEREILTNFFSGGDVGEFANNGMPGSGNPSSITPDQSSYYGDYHSNYGSTPEVPMLPTWTGSGMWYDISEIPNSGYWTGSGDWASNGQSGFWSGSGEYSSGLDSPDGSFKGSTLTGSGYWVTNDESQSGSFTAKAIGSGTTQESEPGAMDGTWQGGGVVTEWTSTTDGTNTGPGLDIVSPPAN